MYELLNDWRRRAARAGSTGRSTARSTTPAPRSSTPLAAHHGRRPVAGARPAGGRRDRHGQQGRRPDHAVHRRAHLVRAQGPEDPARPDASAGATPTATAAAGGSRPAGPRCGPRSRTRVPSLPRRRAPTRAPGAPTPPPSGSTSTPACSTRPCGSRTGRAGSSRCSGSRATGPADERALRCSASRELDHPRCARSCPPTTACSASASGARSASAAPRPWPTR